jgi:hypothetical protein
MENILLLLLPFWDPQIPPSGIACLKSFIQRYGFKITTKDANTEVQLNEVYHQYLNTLKEAVPEEKRGNFYKIGQDVLRHQMMAFLNYENRQEYITLIKLVIYNTFFIDIDENHIIKLDQLIKEFYRRLECYFLELVEKEKPAVLGISVYSGTLPASLFAFKLTKKKYPHIRTVMGGGIFADLLSPGSPDLERFIKETPYIDNIIIGEGELLFLKLLQGKCDEAQKVYTWKDSDTGLLDLSCADIPDFSGFDLGYYPGLFAYSSRSCPYQCSFCTEANLWGKFRKKSASQVVKELIELSGKYGSQFFVMGDSLVNHVATELSRELLKADASIYWDGYLRVDKYACDTEYTMLWRRGGFYRARLGVESGSQHILNRMQKGITVQQTRSAIASLAYAGIKTTTYWVIGHPGETEEEFQKTLDLLEEIAEDIYEADCSPFWYFFTGQVGGDKWKDKRIPLYPANASRILMQQTWIVDGQPTREERYKRMWRFVKHCEKLGIPNPYSLHEFYKADKRWKVLHKNAVPQLVQFKNKDAPFHENKHLKELIAAPGKAQDEGDFLF